MSAAMHLQHLGAKLAAHRLFSEAEPDPVLWQALRAAGVDLDYVLNMAGPTVRVLGTITPDGRFEIDYALGDTFFVMAVHDEDGETVIDLVGWSPRTPESFGTMFGAGVMGIDHLMNPASYVSGPCKLFGSPLAWLKAKCAGAAILDLAAARSALQRAPGPLTTETLTQAEGLLRSGIISGDKILVPTTWGKAA